MPEVRSLVPGETAIALTLASSLWAPQTRSWRQPAPHVRDRSSCPQQARIKSTTKHHVLAGPLGKSIAPKFLILRNTTSGTSLSNACGYRKVSRWQNKTNRTPPACRQRQDIRPPLVLLFARLGPRALGQWCTLERVRTSPSRLLA